MEAWFQPIIEVIEDKIDYKSEKVIITFSRSDGHLLFHLGDEKLIRNQNDFQTISALVGGAWQAASALKDFLNEDSDTVFRLGFDTSSEGVFVLPLEIDGENFYMCALFSSILNPGSFKSKFRVIKNKVEDLQIDVSNPSRKSFLFNDVTDEEVDKMFSFAGI